MNNLPTRKNTRLKDFDYGSYGYYYVTICTNNKKNILCDIVGNDALVVPSKIGKKVIECWNNIAKLNENVEIDKFVLMPNHIHGIIIIKNESDIETIDKQYGFEVAERRGRRSLQCLIKDFKSVTTRHYKKIKNITQEISLWQTSYYDEIIKNQFHYDNIWQYIDTNPLKWELDKYYIKN
jgi:REP element-mobilizing transposase RayT